MVVEEDVLIGSHSRYLHGGRRSGVTGRLVEAGMPVAGFAVALPRPIGKLMHAQDIETLLYMRALPLQAWASFSFFFA